MSTARRARAPGVYNLETGKTIRRPWRLDQELIEHIKEAVGWKAAGVSGNFFDPLIDAVARRHKLDEVGKARLRRNISRLRMLCHEVGAAADVDRTVTEATLALLALEGGGDDLRFLRFAQACPEPAEPHS
ncbi:MAG TPA: hypothetical protein VGU20_14035 [Stellaceae bacterium]|nr:hypothetical protein [Stellaceae bacterium]